MKSREQVADELSRLQRDNESLQGKHRLHLELQQQEDFQMPNTVQVREERTASSSIFRRFFHCNIISEPINNVFCPCEIVLCD